MPESPRWLVSKGKSGKALKVLTKIRNKVQDAQQELQEIEESIEQMRKSTPSSATLHILKKMLHDPPIRRALIVGCSLQLFQQV